MSNSCQCPDPPGGSVTCNTDQMALCIVKNGKAEYICLSPPLIYSDLEIVNWAIRAITNDQRTSDADVTEELMRMLGSGIFFSDDSWNVRFTLPQSVQVSMDELRAGGQELP